MENTIVKRPIARYHGGKWILAPWIISHFPQHLVYVEPYGGAASVLLRKKRSHAEVYNDLSEEMVNLFKMVRDRGDELADAIYNTPFSRDEFKVSKKISTDPLERARRTIARSFMGFGSNSIHVRNSGFRANSNRSGSTPAKDFMNLPESLKMVTERMRGVIIENRPSLDVCKQHDGKHTLIYLDPPYSENTRNPGHDYEFEMNECDHLEMLEAARKMKGYVILSGYDNELYNKTLSGWTKIRKKTFADGARPRVECLWLNKRAANNRPEKTLFDI